MAILFSADFSTEPDIYDGNLCCPHSFTLDDGYARVGDQSGRVELRISDPVIEGGNRAELSTWRSSGHAGALGEERWYGVSLRPSSDWYIGREVVVWQIHSGAGVPPLSDLQIDASGRWILKTTSGTTGSYNRRTVWTGPVAALGEWSDFVLHKVFAADGTGLTELWFNGTQVYSANEANAYSDVAGNYNNKAGAYIFSGWSGSPSEYVIHVDEWRIGNASESYASVAPSSVVTGEDGGGSLPVLTGAGTGLVDIGAPRVDGVDGGRSIPALGGFGLGSVTPPAPPGVTASDGSGEFAAMTGAGSGSVLPAPVVGTDGGGELAALAGSGSGYLSTPRVGGTDGGGSLDVLTAWGSGSVAAPSVTGIDGGGELAAMSGAGAGVVDNSGVCLTSYRRRGLGRLLDHRCNIWRLVETRGAYQETVATHDQVYVSVPCTFQRRNTVIANQEPGTRPVGDRRVYLDPGPVLRDRDVVEIVSGPAICLDEDAVLLEVESIAGPRGHHIELRCVEWKGTLPEVS